MSLPNVISTLPSRGGHIQGIALDRENGWLYCSFTTELVKYDLEGNLLGSVTGLTGHLGCLAMGPDGRVYGSLEYKNDSIGRGIRKNVGGEFLGNAFYIAIFDGAKIDRPDMDACADAVMTTVYLAEVVADYESELEQPGGGKLLHRFGCSGIDGLTFAPLPGDKDGKTMLCVAYGIYGDLSRTDNDHQVILAYDTEGWEELARPLDQAHIHVSGPAEYNLGCAESGIRSGERPDAHGGLPGQKADLSQQYHVHRRLERRSGSSAPAGLRRWNGGRRGSASAGGAASYGQQHLRLGIPPRLHGHDLSGRWTVVFLRAAEDRRRTPQRYRSVPLDRKNAGRLEKGIILYPLYL